MEDSICQSSAVQWDKLAVSAESHRSIANVATPSLRRTVRLGGLKSSRFSRRKRRLESDVWWDLCRVRLATPEARRTSKSAN